VQNQLFQAQKMGTIGALSAGWRMISQPAPGHPRNIGLA